MMVEADSIRRVVAVLQVDSPESAEHALQAVRSARFVQAVALLTGADAQNDAVVEFGRANELTVVRCTGDDILSGFARAAELMDADIVVRVAGETIDGGLIDHLVTALIARDCDLIRPAAKDVEAAAGIVAFTRHALDKLLLDAAGDPAAKCHVTRYFSLHPDFVSSGEAEPYEPAPRKHTGDIAFVESMRARMDANSGRATLADLLSLAERARSQVRPGLGSVVVPGNTALIRVESAGLGRVKRMIMLARALRDREGIATFFSIGGREELASLVYQAGFEACCSSTVLPKGNLAPDLLVVDGRSKPDAVAEASARITAVIEDYSDARLAADFAYYAPLPRASKLAWNDARTCVRIGWEWALPGLSPSGCRPKGRSPRPTVLVSMGAADPQGLTLRVAKALLALDPVFRARFVIGPGFKACNRLAKTMVDLGSNFETIEGAHGLATELASCDLAVTGVHVTACELAAFGVPALYLCADAAEAQAASAYEHAGMGICLGVAGQIPDASIARAVSSLLNNGAKRRNMSVAGPMTVDGGGAARIASELAAALAAANGSVAQSGNV